MNEATTPNEATDAEKREPSHVSLTGLLGGCCSLPELTEAEKSVENARLCMNADHERFRCVMFAKNGCLACELEQRTRPVPNAVLQTTPTNCFRACVATILGLPIDDVPTACDGATWDWDAFQDWLATRGLQAIEVGFGGGGTIYPVRRPVRCIVSGYSPRKCLTGRHAVVGSLLGLEGFELEHDPNPATQWLDDEPTHATFFVPISVVPHDADEWRNEAVYSALD